MGSQQLLLIVVGVIVVGIAVVIGFSMFGDAADGGNIDNAISVSLNESRDAAASIMRGEEMGGYANYGAWVAANDTGSTSHGDFGITYTDPDLVFTWVFNSGGDAVVKVDPETGRVQTTPSQ